MHSHKQQSILHSGESFQMHACSLTAISVVDHCSVNAQAFSYEIKKKTVVCTGRKVSFISVLKAQTHLSIKVFIVSFSSLITSLVKDFNYNKQ